MSKISILYDTKIFSIQKFGGISRYFYELIYNFEMNENLLVKPIIYQDSIINEYLLNNKELSKKFDLDSYSKLSIYKKIFCKYKKFRGKHIVSEANAKPADIFHSTYYCDLYSDNKHMKKIITVYDMIHEIYPELFKIDDRTYLKKRHSILSADHIISISESTKSDLIKFYKIKEEKISVVPLAANFINMKNELNLKVDKFNLNQNEDYFLFVGDRTKYKNFQFIVNGFSRFKKVNPFFKLLIVGGGSLSEGEIYFLKEMLGDQFVYCNSVSDIELNYLLSKAIALIYPSYYEGFGIPILEAYATGCNVICSRTSSVPEVAGPYGLYFDFKDYDSLDDAIKKSFALKNDNKNIESILNWSSQFKWSNSALMTKRVYEKII